MIINLTLKAILKAISRLAPRYAALLAIWFLEQAITVAPITTGGKKFKEAAARLLLITAGGENKVALEVKETCGTCGTMKRPFKSTDGTTTKENVLLCPICWR